MSDTLHPPEPIATTFHEPVAVIVTSPDPLPVVVTNPPPAPPALGPTGLTIQSQLTDPSLPAKTTFQEDLTHAGQRQINLIWERTQAAIALGVVFITMVAGLYGMVKDLPIPTLMAVAFGTVVGFYFSRTNHAAIGGVGSKAQAPYEGR
jgi:hypothetical protein